MQVEINGELVHVPSDVSTIKLGKFIEWYDEHGRQLDKELQDVLENEYDDDLQKEFAIESHLDKEALHWYSFFSGFDFFALKDTVKGEQIFNQYRTIRYLLKKSEAVESEFPKSFEWNGEEWIIQDFVVDPKSEMTVNEIITAKEVTRQIYRIGKGHWDALIYLCAVYFRKKDEPFIDEMIHEGSERMQLLQDLPLDMAINVGFFLSSCVNIWSKTSAYSLNPEEVATVSQN